MKEELAIQRINFIEREPFVLTYRRIAEIGIAAAVLCALLFGGQWLRSFAAGRRLAVLEKEVGALREQSDRLFKQMAGAGGEQGARDALSTIFEKTPPWATLLKELTTTAPRSVWLVSLKQKANPAPTTGMPGLEIAGRSEEAESVAQFLKLLTSSSFFQNVVLASSKRETEAGAIVYSFVIDLSVASPEGKGL